MDALSFREDGTFTIVQFTDVHMKAGEEADERTIALMERIVEAERPDLVFFTGDVIHDQKSDNVPLRYGQAVSVPDKCGIPWAVVFGNHDTEAVITRRQLMELTASYSYAVAEHGPPDITGAGNYSLPILNRNGRTAAVLYGLDSGMMSTVPHVEGYGWICRDQIDWYARQSDAYTERNEGSPVPSLLFIHIPLPEYRDVWEQSVCYGHKYESVCSPQLNTGLFAAMVEKGDVMGTFAGHDHVNDYWGELHGIRLCYGRATGYNTYGREQFMHGARVIRLREGERSFETWLRLEDGSVVPNQPEHVPDSRK